MVTKNVSKNMTNSSAQLSWFQRVERMHPYETLLYLGIIGSGIIFIFLVLAFLFSGLNQLAGLNKHIPIAFLISTFLLILSSYTATQMRLYYQEERTDRLISSLRNTLALGIIFTLLQFIGWYELNQMGVDFQGIPSGSFLYLLSGIHIFHLVGAMIFAAILLIQIRNQKADDIQNLILITNPYEKMRIRLFTFYWHFMDLVWLILFALFALSF
jgi:cytochrome c oxidase subunit 3